MTSSSGAPQLLYVFIAIVVLALSFSAIVWVTRTIRGELGPGPAKGGDAAGLAMLEQIPPAMMKEAIARGLVVPSQLAGMTAVERTFLFASLKQKLAAPPATETRPHVKCPSCGTEFERPSVQK
jgi:hypothetical protein